MCWIRRCLIPELPNEYLFDHTILTLPWGNVFEACRIALSPDLDSEPARMVGAFYTALPLVAEFYILDAEQDYMTGKESDSVQRSTK